MRHLGNARSTIVLAVCATVAFAVMTSMAAATFVSTAAKPWPVGMGVWKFTTEMIPWMDKVGVTWYQNWSGAYGDRGKPYIFEIKTANWSDATIKSWIKNRGANCFGVNIDCEVSKTTRTQYVAKMVRTMAPNLKVFSGNMDWALQAQNKWAWTDGVMCFYNCTRYNRCAADVFYFVALSYYYQKPLCFSVQGQDAEGVKPASMAEFTQALTYATNAQGQIIWPGDRLAKYDWPDVNNALMTYPTDITRPMKVVKFANNYKKDMALCRIVAYKGYLPVASTTSGITWSNITVPSTYFSNLTKYYDTGSTKSTVISQEKNMIVRW